MNRIISLLILICGVFSQSACLSAQSDSSLTASPINLNSNLQTKQSYSSTPINQLDGALFQAILKNDLDGVIAALEKGANPNATINLKEIGERLTPLALAVEKNEKIVDLLLAKGANPNTFSKFYVGSHQELRSFSPLMLSAKLSKIEAVRLLLNNKADVNLKNESGFPTLFAAVSDTEILRLMLEKGANPNTQDNQGVTPLMAVVSGASYDKTKIERVKLLVENGADPNIKDKSGRTAIDIARSYNDASMTEFLQQYVNEEKQSLLIGILETEPSLGGGCFFFMPSDWNKTTGKIRYFYHDNSELGPVMNLNGKDVQLDRLSSHQIKSPNKGQSNVWNFRSGDIKIRFVVTQMKTACFEESACYDALITVTKGNQKQSVKARGYCGS